MTLHYSAAHSSRISKPKIKSPLLRRSSSSFSTFARRKSSSETPKKPEEHLRKDDDTSSEPLPDHGRINSLVTESTGGHVEDRLRYIHHHMFENIPTRAGMNSTRISEVLNYRRDLPPIVTVAHLLALSSSPTTTEREVADLVRTGVVRRLRIPGRGLGSAAIGDSLVLVEKWVAMVEECDSLDQDLKTKYITALHTHPSTTSLPATTFTPPEATTLTKSGFLTSPSPQPLPALLPPLLTSSLSNISRAPSGSIAAVGGPSAIHDAGGGSACNSNPKPPAERSRTSELNFCLPSTGLYLRLLESARAHLLHLLARSKYREAPKDLLRERWDGGVASEMVRSGAGGGGGGGAVVLPGRTKKWKQFYGMRFEWVLEECLGTGVVELFETGSVGMGVRMV